MNRKLKLIGIASLIGFAPLGLAILNMVKTQHQFYINYLLYAVDSNVSFFDHVRPGAASANLLAITTGFMGGITAFSHGHPSRVIRTVTIVSTTAFATAWLASKFGVRFGYVLTLLAIQSIVAFGLMRIIDRQSMKQKRTRKYSIVDILALTTVVAIGAVSFGQMQSAVMHDTSIVYWVFVLGVATGTM